MTRRQVGRVSVALLVLSPAAIGVWYYFAWPAREQARRLAEARQALDAGDAAAAQEGLRRVLEEDPDRVEALRLYVAAARRLGRTAEARTVLDYAAAHGLPD